ncbi:ATP-binding protein [Nitriliruptor alkaliphilus]|uniref:ATP-binding protein n=1 Tax=Nitriliruptor alkaliphilus TaxID=427918 RepID=UPI000695D79E|nr:ATP-binding protein [Nitriliruptor alkaliphilus]
MLHLLDRLAIIEWRVRDEVQRRRSEAAEPTDDRFRGLFVSDGQVDTLLASLPHEPIIGSPELVERFELIESAADDLEVGGADLRLRRLASAFDLLPLDVELLLIAVAPDLDRRFEPLYGYLNDDVSLRRATVGLALQLCGTSTVSSRARGRLAPTGPLLRAGLVEVATWDRPVLSRELRVPDRVTAHLLGDDAPDPALTALVVAPEAMDDAAAQQLARGFADGAVLAYLRDDRASAAPSSAASAFATLGLSTVALDLERLGPRDDASEVALAACRDARLRGSGLVVGPVEALEGGGPSAVQAFADGAVTVVLHGRVGWDPRWSRDVPIVVDAPRVAEEVRAELWAAELPADGLADGLDALEATSLFRLTPGQIRRAARFARYRASAADRPITQDDLQSGARAQNAAGLQRLARRITPVATWDDLVLPRGVEEQVRELAARWRHRDLVLERWGVGRGTARGRGVSALFAGGSGTGKTLTAEVIAGELGLDLYVVDLSTIVDKYIGETSKNLERIFDQADRVNGVLLFDEADALFGKRSAVSDAKDRHANVEVAFLLQRMESFDGVAILTTNLAANLDEAFMRRLDAVVDFPSPDEPQRLALWRARFPVELPRAEDVDLELLAARFKLSGSEIQNIVVSAAYRAAEDSSPVSMDDLVRATIREHRKIGRHLAASDLVGFEHLQHEPGS